MSRGNNRNNKNKNPDGIDKVINKINKGCEKLKEIPTKELIDVDTGCAYIVAKNSNKLKTTQLRKFFGAIRSMEQKQTWEEIETDFYLFKPRMAVAVGRGNVPRPFFNVIMAAMGKVDVGSDEEKMENLKVFINFFEAIVAYRKYEE